MDQSPTPEDIHPNGRLIDAGLHVAVWLLLEIRRMLAPGLGARELSHLVRHYLRPAEAALRRAICLIGDTLEPESARATTKSVRPRASGGRDPQGPAVPRTPAFRLTESLPRPKTDYLPPAMRPRISIAGLAPPPPAPAPRKPADPAALAAKLERRLAAFDAALADLRAAARRLRRLRTRKAKRVLLAFTVIPGISAKPVNAEARGILERLNRAAFEVFRVAADTS